MGRSFFPTRDGADVGTPAMRRPTSQRLDGYAALSPGAQEVINNSASVINAFVFAQRQNAQLSGVQIYRTSLVTPDVDVDYQMSYGVETITVTPYPRPQPKSEPPPLELTANPEETPSFPTPLRSNPRPLYLMVLYAAAPKGGGTPTQNGIAAFDMGSISPKGATLAYNATVNKTTWVENAGAIVPVAQYNFGKHGFILTPLDFAKGKAHQALTLSTTALTDGVQGKGDIGVLPVMNLAADGSEVYTAAGSFKLDDKGKLTLATPLPTDPDRGTLVYPIAIGSDGTAYYYPYFGGSLVSVAVAEPGPKSTDQSKKTAVQPGGIPPSLYKQVTDAEDRASADGKVPILVPFYAAESVDHTTYTNQPVAEGVAHGFYGDVTQYGYIATTTTTASYHITIVALKIGEQGAVTNNGISYYGLGAFGRPPALSPIGLSYSPGVVNTYSLDTNSYGPVLGSGSSSDWSNKYPVTVYTYNKKTDNVQVSLVDARATGSVNSTVVVDPDKSKRETYGAYPQSVLGSYQPNGPLDSYNVDRFSVAWTTDGVYNPVLPYPTPQSVFDNIASQALASIGTGSGTATIAGRKTYTSAAATTVAVTTSHADGRPSTTTITGSGGDGDPSTFDNPRSALTGGTSSGTQSFIYSLDGHLPYDAPYTLTVTGTVSIDLFGEHLEGVSSAQGSTSVRMETYAFPPAIKVSGITQFFYKITTSATSGGTPGRDSYKLVTPYETPIVTDATFTPWMHISNGKHVIQAYYIDKTPYAHVDGDKTNEFLKAIAKVLKCAETDIVAMYMDIELSAIKAVAAVSAPDYSQSDVYAKAAPKPPGT